MCGIYGIIYKKNYTSSNIILQNTFHGLQQLVHRGKDGFGLSWVSKGFIHKTKQLGDISQYEYSQIITDDYSDIQSCIGHTRYSTSGNSHKTEQIQPLSSRIGNFQLIHNGNIPNVLGHDTHQIIVWIERYLKQGFSLYEALIQFIDEVPAAFCLLIQTPNELIICRDRYGIRPLCIAETTHSYIISSETVALPESVTTIKHILPGEIISCKETYQTIHIHLPKLYLKPHLCLFEMIYFAHEHSDLDGLSVTNFRKQLATTLAKQDIQNQDFLTSYPKDSICVVGIPSTGILYGQTYAKEMNLPYHQLIVRNKTVNTRSFITNTPEQRKHIANHKFHYLTNSIQGKHLVIIDDSIVRGNIMESIIRNCREQGAASIHIRIPSPPVIDICQLGISIRSQKELLVSPQESIEQIRKKLQCDSLHYLSLEKIQSLYPEYPFYAECFGKQLPIEIQQFLSKRI